MTLKPKAEEEAKWDKLFDKPGNPTLEDWGDKTGTSPEAWVGNYFDNQDNSMTLADYAAQAGLGPNAE